MTFSYHSMSSIQVISFIFPYNIWVLICYLFYTPVKLILLLHLLTLLEHGILKLRNNRYQWLTTITNCASLIWRSTIKRAAVLSINSSVLILSFIGKVITEFSSYFKSNLVALFRPCSIRLAKVLPRFICSWVDLEARYLVSDKVKCTKCALVLIRSRGI